MEIDDALITQWEPKIQKMLTNVFVLGLDRDDIAQELRISLIKTARAYDPNRGVLFHTYLHTSLVNTIRSLISRAQKHLQLHVQSLDAIYTDTGLQSGDVIEALIDPVEQEELFELDDWVATQNLGASERLFIKLRLEGLTMEEITEDLGESAYKVRQTLREQFAALGYG